LALPKTNGKLTLFVLVLCSPFAPTSGNAKGKAGLHRGYSAAGLHRGYSAAGLGGG